MEGRAREGWRDQLCPPKPELPTPLERVYVSSGGAGHRTPPLEPPSLAPPPLAESFDECGCLCLGSAPSRFHALERESCSSFDGPLHLYLATPSEDPAFDSREPQSAAAHHSTAPKATVAPPASPEAQGARPASPEVQDIPSASQEAQGARSASPGAQVPPAAAPKLWCASLAAGLPASQSCSGGEVAEETPPLVLRIDTQCGVLPIEPPPPLDGAMPPAAAALSAAAGLSLSLSAEAAASSSERDDHSFAEASRLAPPPSHPEAKSDSTSRREPHAPSSSAGKLEGQGRGITFLPPLPPVDDGVHSYGSARSPYGGTPLHEADGGDVAINANREVEGEFVKGSGGGGERGSASGAGGGVAAVGLRWEELVEANLSRTGASLEQSQMQTTWHRGYADYADVAGAERRQGEGVRRAEDATVNEKMTEASAEGARSEEDVEAEGVEANAGFVRWEEDAEMDDMGEEDAEFVRWEGDAETEDAEANAAFVRWEEDADANEMAAAKSVTVRSEQETGANEMVGENAELTRSSEQAEVVAADAETEERVEVRAAVEALAETARWEEDTLSGEMAGANAETEEASVGVDTTVEALAETVRWEEDALSDEMAGANTETEEANAETEEDADDEHATLSGAAARARAPGEEARERLALLAAAETADYEAAEASPEAAPHTCGTLASTQLSSQRERRGGAAEHSQTLSESLAIGSPPAEGLTDISAPPAAAAAWAAAADGEDDEGEEGSGDECAVSEDELPWRHRRGNAAGRRPAAGGAEPRPAHAPLFPPAGSPAKVFRAKRRREELPLPPKVRSRASTSPPVEEKASPRKGRGGPLRSVSPWRGALERERELGPSPAKKPLLGPPVAFAWERIPNRFGEDRPTPAVHRSERGRAASARS
ncbi:hypothetical protein AB1Y20_006508 [Prymnesium parvum]|uniref:Uncharacterized protein n=1 Tax=Prymnesium parvum TaxID=97485 RepID=A0AB34IXX7_PRYPA